MSHTTLPVHDRVCNNEDAGYNSTSLTSLQDRLHMVEKQIYSVAPGLARDLFLPHRPIANPAPLGLFGFALVSILAGAAKLTTSPEAPSAGLLSATAFFLGGMAQIIASIFQFLNNKVHSATTFAVFGMHWSTQAFVICIHALADVDFANDTPPGVIAVYFAVLTVVTIILWVPTFRMNMVLQATLFFVILVFSFDVGAAFQHRPSQIISGICAIIASSLALYMGMLELVNEAWKKPILSLFPYQEVKEDYETRDAPPFGRKSTSDRSDSVSDQV